MLLHLPDHFLPYNTESRHRLLAILLYKTDPSECPRYEGSSKFIVSLGPGTGDGLLLDYFVLNGDWWQ